MLIIQNQITHLCLETVTSQHSEAHQTLYSNSPLDVHNSQQQQSNRCFAGAYGQRDEKLPSELVLCGHHDVCLRQVGVMLSESIQRRHQQHE